MCSCVIYEVSCYVYVQRLLILDVNGLLLRRQPRPFQPTPVNHYFTAGHYVMLRPGLTQFLHFLFRFFKVGLWSSMKVRDLQSVINVMQFAGVDFTYFEFLLDRSYCYEDPEYQHPHLPFAEMYTKPFLHIPHTVDPCNTILLDEHREKGKYNPTGSTLVIQGFNADPQDDYLQEILIPYLWRLYNFEGNAVDFVWYNELPVLFL